MRGGFAAELAKSAIMGEKTESRRDDVTIITSIETPSYVVNVDTIPTPIVAVYCLPTGYDMTKLAGERFYRDDDIAILVTLRSTTDRSINGTTLTLIIKDSTTGTPVLVVSKTLSIVLNSDTEIRGEAVIQASEMSTLAANSAVTLEYRLKVKFPTDIDRTLERGCFTSVPALP